MGTNIQILSSKKLSDEEKEPLVKNLLSRKAEYEKKSCSEKRESSSTESDDEDNKNKDQLKKTERKFYKLKTPLEFFQKSLAYSDKGVFHVWRTNIKIFSSLSTTLHVHAVNDSKPVFRVSNFYGAIPTGSLLITETEKGTGRKVKKEVKTSEAHCVFRKKMGFNDQSDAKRSILRLSSKQYRRWPQKLLAKTLEDALINAYLNSLLDKSCEVEPWTTWVFNLVSELLEAGKNMRMRKMKPVGRFRILHRKIASKRPRPGSDAVLKVGEKCPAGLETVRHLSVSQRSKRCAFCGRSKAAFRCRSCRMHLCMQRPKHNVGRKFRRNGPSCFLRFHGISKYPR